MTSSAAGGAQVEKALDDLIQRLSKGDSTAAVRAALIEARRLRNVTMRWAAIPPPPDARREMMTRVMDLVAKAGVAARSQPPPSPSAPSLDRQKTIEVPPSGPEITLERPPVRALSPFGGQLARPAVTPSAPVARPPSGPPPGEFRSNPAGGMTRPRANGGLAQPKARPAISDLPELDAVAPPRAPPAPPSRKPPEAPRAPEPPRSLSPSPRAASLSAQLVGPAARGLTPSASFAAHQSPIPSLKKEPSPLPAALRTSSAPAVPPRRGTAAGLRPIGGSSFGEPSPLPPPASPPRAKSPTLEFEIAAQSPRPPSMEPRPSQPATPRVDTAQALRAMSGPASVRAPHRAHTIAGIPEANEAFLEALRRGKDPSVEPPPDFEAVRARSSMPTASPPPPGDAPPKSTGAPPPLRRSAAKETLMMGSINAAGALEALRGGRPPVFDGFDDEPEQKPPSTKPSSPENIAVRLPPRSAPPSPRRPSGTMPAAGGSAPPILAIPVAREGRLDGFSSSVSAPSMASVNPTAQRKPSSPTQIMGSAPTSVRPSPMPERPLRTVIGPGVTIVRPDAAQWQPHPIAAGVTIKLLFRDPRSGVYTALVRLAPGSVLGKRRHTAAEEMLLVSGIATVGAHEMRAGEYCRAEADTVHDAITTSTGCTFFLCGSEHDEFLDP